MAENYIEVTGQDFAEKVLNAPQMVLVNFSTEQAGACKIQNPEFEAVSKEYLGSVTFAKLDTDTNSDITGQWNVDGVPTIIFFKGGKEINRIKGIMMRERLSRQVKGALLAN